MKPVGWGDAATPKVLQDLRTMLGGGLTFKDNMNCALVTIDCTHNTETRVTNPLRTNPIAFFPISSMAITTVGGQSNGVARPIDGYPVLNTSRTDGYLGLTVRFAAPAGLCSLYRSAAYDVPDNANTAVPFDSTAFASGSLSYDATTTGILCASAGFVQVGYSLDIAATAAGVRRAFITRTGSVSVDIWGRETDAGTASPTGMSGSALISVSAADYLQLIVLQNSGGVLALSIAQNRVRLDARYVAPSVDALGRVTGILVGA